MKKIIVFLSFAVILTLTVTLATAGSAIVLQGDVPFDFYVENQLVPAGQYNFEMGRVGDSMTDSVTVLTTDGTVVAFVPTRPGNRQNGNPSQLSFHNYNGTRYLSSVECPGFKADLRKAKPTSIDSIPFTSTDFSHTLIALEIR